MNKINHVGKSLATTFLIQHPTAPVRLVNIVVVQVKVFAWHVYMVWVVFHLIAAKLTFSENALPKRVTHVEIASKTTGKDKDETVDWS